jgi:ABC-2 type transport system permease protein
MTNLTNIAAVAQREYTTRVRTRTFAFGTVMLVVGVLAIAFLPVIIGYVDRTDATKGAVHVSAADLATDPVATLDAVLNGTAQSDGGGRDFIITAVPDLAAAREAVVAGTYAGVLDIARTPTGELAFTLYTAGNATGREATLIRQASTAIAIADRLARAGVSPAEQAGLFVPPTFAVSLPDPAATGPAHGSAELINQDVLGFGMTILIFMMVVMYGQWIAMSVVEEKSSRVMEVVLNAATPFQLLTGKVLGVGAVAFTQYAALLLAGGVAILAQGSVATMVLGAGGDAGLPAGLTIGLLLIFGVYGVLGFLLFAVLYAAAASLVSRQEDVNAIVMPMTLVATAGYLVAVYTTTGLIDIRADWLAVITQIPLVSPFMMLSRISSGQATAWEVVLSITLLVVAIVGALWVAARIYRAGVLLYGQRPGVRDVWRLVRSGA